MIKKGRVYTSIVHVVTLWRNTTKGTNNYHLALNMYSYYHSNSFPEKFMSIILRGCKAVGPQLYYAYPRPFWPPYKCWVTFEKFSRSPKFKYKPPTEVSWEYTAGWESYDNINQSNLGVNEHWPLSLVTQQNTSPASCCCDEGAKVLSQQSTASRAWCLLWRRQIWDAPWGSGHDACTGQKRWWMLLRESCRDKRGLISICLCRDWRGQSDQ